MSEYCKACGELRDPDNLGIPVCCSHAVREANQAKGIRMEVAWHGDGKEWHFNGQTRITMEEVLGSIMGYLLEIGISNIEFKAYASGVAVYTRYEDKELHLGNFVPVYERKGSALALQRLFNCEGD